MTEKVQGYDYYSNYSQSNLIFPSSIGSIQRVFSEYLQMNVDSELLQQMMNICDQHQLHTFKKIRAFICFHCCVDHNIMSNGKRIVQRFKCTWMKSNSPDRIKHRCHPHYALNKNYKKVEHLPMTWLEDWTNIQCLDNKTKDPNDFHNSIRICGVVFKSEDFINTQRWICTVLHNLQKNSTLESLSDPLLFRPLPVLSNQSTNTSTTTTTTTTTTTGPISPTASSVLITNSVTDCLITDNSVSIPCMENFTSNSNVLSTSSSLIIENTQNTNKLPPVEVMFGYLTPPTSPCINNNETELMAFITIPNSTLFSLLASNPNTNEIPLTNIISHCINNNTEVYNPHITEHNSTSVSNVNIPENIPEHIPENIPEINADVTDTPTLTRNNRNNYTLYFGNAAHNNNSSRVSTLGNHCDNLVNLYPLKRRRT